MLLTIPLEIREVGLHGPFESEMLAADLVECTLDFTHGSLLWPDDGEVMRVVVEESDDAGATWRDTANATIHGGEWIDKKGKAVTASWWKIGMPNTGIESRKIRISFDVLQPNSMAVDVS